MAASTLLSNVIRVCRTRRRGVKLSDATGAELSGARVLASALALRSALRSRLDRDEPRVAVLLPPSAAAVVANLALAFDGRASVGLNYSLTADLLNRCLAQTGVRHVITSRRFLARVPLALDAEFIYLEDLQAGISKRNQLVAAALAHVAPSSLLLRALGRKNVAVDEPLTIVFTSGTTGTPKGAVLTYGNAEASVTSVTDAMRFDKGDVVLGVLPFFHGFGTILTLWTALSLDIEAAYCPNPLDARGVGQLCRKRKATILLATPTFLRAYQRRGAASDFASLNAILTGGERLTCELADAVERDFGARPVEGYGCTEASSLISSNVPPDRIVAGSGAVAREGTVGRLLPGILAEVRDAEGGHALGPDAQGLLWISGANVMAGYHGNEAATADVMRDGWYCTGDIAVIHQDGCVEIAGRRSRFAKVGGEMVPLGMVEDALMAQLGDDGEADSPPLAVVAVADDSRGERLVVLHRRLDRSPADLRRGVIASGLPPVFAPAAADFFELAELPITATGKLDLGRLRQIASSASSLV